MRRILAAAFADAAALAAPPADQAMSVPQHGADAPGAETEPALLAARRYAAFRITDN